MTLLFKQKGKTKMGLSAFYKAMLIIVVSRNILTKFVFLFSGSLTLCNYYCCSVTKLCSPLCDPMNCSIPVFPYLLEFAQIHVY